VVDGTANCLLGTGAVPVRITTRVVPSLVVAVLVAGGAIPRPAAREEPSDVLRAFVSALNHADIDAITSLFAADATAFLPLDSSPSELVGRDAIRAAMRPLFQDLREHGTGPEYMHLVPKSVHIRSSASVAVVTFDAGTEPVTSRRTLVLELTSDGWLISHFHGSNIRQ